MEKQKTRLSNIVMQPYKPGSKSAKNLAERIGQLSSRRVRRLHNENSKFVPKESNTVINWGLSASPNWNRNNCKIINPFDRVRRAANKLETFTVLRDGGDVPIPDYTSDRQVAATWLAEGHAVVVRHKLSGHSGDGIEIISQKGSEIPNAPLYTKYLKKKSEYRVHVAFGKVIDIQQKKKRADYEGEVDFNVRNHHTGWVYCREGVEVSQKCREIALRTVLLLGLDFGAVDIIYNSHYDVYTVLEVNTAPGLEGQTVENYATAFSEALK